MKNTIFIIFFSLFLSIHFLFAQNNHFQIGNNFVYHQEAGFYFSKQTPEYKKAYSFLHYVNPSLSYLHTFKNTHWGIGTTVYATAFRLPDSRTIERIISQRKSQGIDVCAYYNARLNKQLFNIGLGISDRLRMDEITYQPESWSHSATESYWFNDIGLAIPASYMYQIGRHWNVGASAVGRLYFKQKSNTFSYGINMGCSF